MAVRPDLLPRRDSFLPGSDLTRIGPPEVEKEELDLGARGRSDDKGFPVLPALLIVGALAYLYFRGRK